MPNLQLHQLRVAAVTKLVCDSLDMPVDTHAVVAAALLHDMGNIIKFDLSVFPDFCEPEGLEYWQSVKQEYLDTYGNDEHDATVAIARSVGVSDTVLRLVDGIGFSNLARVREGDWYEMKIAEYGDLRVGPHGVVPLLERLEEARGRYKKRYASEEESLRRYTMLADAGTGIEVQIFARSRITPSDITDAAVEPVIEQLKHFQVV